MTTLFSRSLKMLQWTSFAVGLAIALVGLANVLPTYGVLPRVGPFELDWFRPLFYWLCFLNFLIWDAQRLAQQERLTVLHVALYTVALALMSWVCWDYYQISMILKDSFMFFSAREAWMAAIPAVLSIIACWRLWGGPIAILGAIVFGYLVTGPYWPGVFETIIGDMNEFVAQNIWYDASQGILGNIMGIVLSTVLPFIILGAVLEGCGAGASMIRISFHLMRRFRGGPAYAAIFASALFGTVSGSAVANVVGTGVVTIPMIRRRGFSGNFAGAVEASASTGGQILPPIMGAAALVMADIVGVSYLTVILAVVIPAIAYYASLFLTVFFEAEKLGIVAREDEEANIEKPMGQDWVNLALVFGPIALIVWLLISGLSPAGASIAAILALVPMSFINPDVRRAPWKLIVALADGGKTVAQLAIAISIVGIVVSTLNATGMPTKFAVLLSAAANSSLIAALLIAAGGCIVLGMGMPTLPAYIAIVAVMGPTLTGFGVDLLTAHLFVFFFGVASVITPPVAIAAYAAASISKGTPIGTAVEATRVGAMIFIIPFAFVYNPALLLGSEAAAAASFGFVFFSLLTLAVSLYQAASALIGFDKRPLPIWERLLRIICAMVLLSPYIWAGAIALILSVALIIWRRMATRNSRANSTSARLTDV
ncbi:TRAP transporter fused permease subunit [Halomonas sp. PAMB 3264]|uniref:TRAP transporter permease n=1 Tax=Halomonas sp. PAMB 3264 TaxID=3075222 RepID=UPI002899802F|nr:TRAP transporter fused permease subunit [Halomonas sp. PAMB 3264]WNL42409.1 TRAP transporter fused permease subunit [Halomonas sp. PAMB 3264]